MLNRRKMLRNTALGLSALAFPGLPLRAEDMDMEPSGASPALTPFVDALRIPPVLTPVMNGKTALYTVTMKAGFSKIHRDLPKTVIWGFDGLFPGPTIKATKGQPVVIRQINRLPTAFSAGMGDMPLMNPAVHLHGTHSEEVDDGSPREAIPPGSYRDYHYPNRQRAMNLLFHDHSHGQTGLHVFYGMAGLYLIEDPEEQVLGLPSGEFDIPLLIQDRIFNTDGAFLYSLDSNTRETGVLGDTILVNGVAQPYLKVARRKYRFRIVNGSNARMYEMQLSSGAPLIQIGTDGGLLPEPLPKTVIEISPFERVDLVIDFATYPLGAQIILKNCDTCTGRLASIMRFDVESNAVDNSMVPDCLSSWQDLPITATTVKREFTLNRQIIGGETFWTINGKTFELNNPPLAQVKYGEVELWRFFNPTTHRHPVHIHLIQFQVLEINGVAQDPSRHGWKDVLVAPPGGSIAVAARFTGHRGKFLFHCHNLEHEDLGMMAEFEVV
jgi:spore coat protein A